MNIENYDFETALEQGFKTLFDEAGLALLVADDVDFAIADEAITFQLDTGGPGSDEHLNAAGEYDTYIGTIDIEIRTPRVTAATASAQFTNRQSELVATTRQLLEEIDGAKLALCWPGAISPTKIKPSGTQREIDQEFKFARLSYDMQFRIT